VGFPADLAFPDDDWLDHESWIRYCYECLGNVSGKQVLDYGCGAGFSTVVLARRGAWVSAFDLSPEQVALAGRRADANGVGDSVTLEVMAAEQLRYADSSFDVVHGNAVLHHVDLSLARLELKRVMKPGAVAVFAEPLGENLLLEFARSYLPYPGKLPRDPGERPLRYSDIAFLAEPFGHIQVREFQLLSMIGRVTRNRAFVRRLERLDEKLFAGFPSVRRFCRYVVIRLQKGTE
jgi:SAM-dependent methyltransferase